MPIDILIFVVAASASGYLSRRIGGVVAVRLGYPARDGEQAVATGGLSLVATPRAASHGSKATS